MFKIFVVASFVLSSMGAFAQRTDSMSLRNMEHVPLFDCSILSDYVDRTVCKDLRQGRDTSWSNRGYAVSCYEFSRRKQSACLDLARAITLSSYAFTCDHLRSESYKQCDIARRAYENGHFRGNDYRENDYRDYRDERTTTTTTTVINNGPMVCDYSYFDSSYARWKQRNDEQRRQGEERARNGFWIGLGGLILGQSDNDIVSTIGDGMAIGGAVMVASGLIEMNMADNDMPHMRPGCSNGYRAETKRVVVERRECISTRYTEVNRNSSRSYYEVRCENRSYVTYERFNAWEQSNRWYTSY